jgi:hypothetical protein
MHGLKCLSILAVLTMVEACGGGASAGSQAAPSRGTAANSADAPQLHFVVDYELSHSPMFPAGTVQVSPRAGEMAIGKKPIAKVELLLFGHDKQELAAANFQPKGNPQLRYVFRLPDSFAPGIYRCGSGAHVSEVRVTDADGVTVSELFELCPGTPFQTSASGP